MQILTLFVVVPAAADGFLIPAGAIVLLLLSVISLTVIMSHGRWTLIAGVVAFILTGIATVLQQKNPSIEMDIVRSAVALATFCVLGVVVSKAVFSPGRFTGHRIRGAIVLYMNTGLIFSFLHRITALLLPGSYSHLPNPLQVAEFSASFDYFSFTTMTSVGFGDIVPVRAIARSLCAFESIVGQLLPTLLIARVVGLATTGASRG
jgi:hypothetical protein